MAVKKQLKDFLVDKKVFIEPIDTQIVSSIFHKAKEEAVMMTGTVRNLTPPVNDKGYFVQALSEEEIEVFERELKLNLNVRDIGKRDMRGNLECYWDTKQPRIVFRKDSKSLSSASIILNLKDPYDYLQYKMCLIHPRVANSWTDRHDGISEFVLKDLDAEYIEQLDKTKVKASVLEYIIKNKASFKHLYDLLRLFSGNAKTSKRPKNSATTDWLFTELFSLVEKDYRNAQAIYKIINLDLKQLEGKIFVEDAIDVGSILIKGNAFEVLGVDSKFYSKEELVKFLSSAANSSIRLRLESEIKDKQKI